MYDGANLLSFKIVLEDVLPGTWGGTSVSGRRLIGSLILSGTCGELVARSCTLCGGGGGG